MFSAVLEERDLIDEPARILAAARRA